MTVESASPSDSSLALNLDTSSLISGDVAKSPGVMRGFPSFSPNLSQCHLRRPAQRAKPSYAAGADAM